jgi:MFS family permease
MGRRPGRPLATLLAAGAVSNLGDGVTLAAAPLLAASITRDPRAIAAVGVAWSLPWLLFALVSGAVADRTDRRRLMVGADLVRVGSLAALTAAVLGGRASIPALVALFFVNATAETVFDTAWQSTLPMVVEREELPRANGWLQTVEFAANGLLGPALGGVLFAAAAAAPFAVDAVSFGVSALLLATLPGRFRAARPAAGLDVPAAGGRPTLRADIAEGVRWLLGHRVLRTICWVLAIENIVEMAGFAMLVLLAQDVLGLDARGYGLLLACLAVGGVVGGTVAARLHRHLGDQGSVVGSILLMSAAWALLAATSVAVLAGAGVALYGLAAVWWNVVTVSFRQAVVPERLQGRVNSAYRLVSWGTLSVGAAAGGVVAAQFGLRPLYAGAAVVLLALAGVAWRLLDAGSFAAARAAAGPSPEVGPA